MPLHWATPLFLIFAWMKAFIRKDSLFVFLRYLEIRYTFYIRPFHHTSFDSFIRIGDFFLHTFIVFFCQAFLDRFRFCYSPQSDITENNIFYTLSRPGIVSRIKADIDLADTLNQTNHGTSKSNRTN